MQKIAARSIFNLDKNAIWNIDKNDTIVVYEDNIELQESYKEIIFNRYCWEMFLLYPNTPITSKCSVHTLLEKEYYNSDIHIKILETIFKWICEYNQLNTYSIKEPLLRITQFIVNDIYNNIVNRISEYVTTIDATDFIEIVNDPDIKEIHGSMKPTPEGVDQTYKKIKQYLTSSTNKTNRFIHAYKSKSINENQANQCIGPRGFIIDLDRTVFRQPVVNGFIKGMGNLFEIMAESRTAAKSLNASDNHIKQSEYASRRIQLLTMVVENIVNTDCGSTEYFNLFITKDILDNIKGKYYLNEETNQLNYIKGNETHLINKFIKVRTTLGCRIVQDNYVCTTCLGKVSENFKENSNLGYIMTSHLMEKTSQSILSTKHLTHSAKKSLIKLEGNANKYFYINDDNDLFFNKDIDLNGISIIIPNNKLIKLVDVLNMQHSNVALNKIGEIDEIFIKDDKHKVPLIDNVVISYNDRSCIITKFFLEHIKNSKIKTDMRGNFIIPLDNYNKDLPIFNNPLKESDMISFVNNITSIIETIKNKQTDPYEKLDLLFTTILDKFKCNLSVLEILIYATTAYNVFNHNYRLGRNSQHLMCERRSTLFRHRSVGQLLVFQDQAKELINNFVIMFSNHHRQNHPLDVLFHPQSIVK